MPIQNMSKGFNFSYEQLEALVTRFVEPFMFENGFGRNVTPRVKGTIEYESEKAIVEVHPYGYCVLDKNNVDDPVNGYNHYHTDGFGIYSVIGWLVYHNLIDLPVKTNLSMYNYAS